MDTTVRRALLVAASLLLALPPGWCCVAPSAPAGPAQAPARHACCHGGRKAPASRTSIPTPRPAPLGGPSCPCFDRAPAKPARPGIDTTDSSLPPAPALTPALPIANAVGGTAPPSRRAPSPSLQLLHCVWLC